MLAGNNLTLSLVGVAICCDNCRCVLYILTMLLVTEILLKTATKPEDGLNYFGHKKNFCQFLKITEALTLFYKR
jgi:hypothetical protein